MWTAYQEKQKARRVLRSRAARASEPGYDCPVTSRPDETLLRLLRGYYWYARPALLLAYGVALLKGRSVVHPLDIVMLALLWCLPFWVRLRLVPGVRKRQPELGEAFQGALAQLDTQRQASKLPWVRARP